MQIIASNITTRSRSIADALRPRQAELASPKAAERLREERTQILQSLARRCVSAGAQILDVNLQHEYDKPEMMKFAVEAIQNAVDARLCLSANRVDTLEAGLKACRKPPMVNYITLEKERLTQVLPLAARHSAGVILIPTNLSAPGRGEEIMQAAAALIGAARESGITSDRILVDPGMFHITSDTSLRHLQTLGEVFPALAQFDPPVKTTCWIGNISAGIPQRLRSSLNRTLLAMLAGFGLSSAFIDVLDRELMRTARIAGILNNELIYAERELELK